MFSICLGVFESNFVLPQSTATSLQTIEADGQNTLYRQNYF